MVEPRVLARGPFLPEQIRVTVSETSNQKTSPASEEHIEDAWKTMLKDAEAKGKRLWNGVTQRVNQLSVEGNTLFLELAPLDFKHRECVLSYPGYYTMDESYWRKGAYVSSFVVTSDGDYVFVALSGKSVNNKPEEVVGGVIGDEGPVMSGADLYGEMYRELEEEASVTKDGVKNISLELVYLGPRTNIGFHFVIHLKDTRAELEARFAASENDHDVRGLVFVEQADLPRKLEEMGGYKPFVGRELGLV